MANLMEDDTNVQKSSERPAGKKRSRAAFFLAAAFILLALPAALYYTGALSRFFPDRDQGDQVGLLPRHTVPLQEFQVNLADAGARRFLRMRIFLAFNDRPLVKEIAEREPEIRSNIIAVLRSKTVADLDGPAGMEALEQTLVDMLNGLLHGGEIVSLYFVEFIVQ